MGQKPRKLKNNHDVSDYAAVFLDSAAKMIDACSGRKPSSEHLRISSEWAILQRPKGEKGNLPFVKALF
jgi:hypothetical protein